MNISDITAEGFVNTDRLENTLVHIINEKKDSEKGPLSYIDTRLFVKKFMDNYEKHFMKSINDCYLNTYEDIFSDIATRLDEDKAHKTMDAYKSGVIPGEIKIHHTYKNGGIMYLKEDQK